MNNLNHRLQFDFLANKENNTLTIVREFAAARQLVWDCYTKQELLDQWFAPKPFTVKTKSMNFKSGGHWHYAMVSPEGHEYWGYTQYFDVNPIDFYRTSDAFCDDEGKVNADLPQATWLVQFADNNKHSIVTTVVQYASLADLETVLNMGMKDGLAATLENLDDLLLTLNT